MKPTERFPGTSFAIAAAVNGGLCIALGALLGGLRGSQLGLSIGLVLAALPVVVRFVATRLARPDSIARLVAREVAAATLAMAGGVLDKLGHLLAPIAGAARGPLLLSRFVAFVAVGSVEVALAAVVRTLATPLGIANLVGLAAVVLGFGGSEFATLAVLVGLPTMVIVLIVDLDESRGSNGSTIEGGR